MKETTRKAIVETVKELGRIVLFGGLAALAGYLTEKLNGMQPTELYYIVMTVMLRLIDKFIHQNTNIALKGLAPF